MRLIVLLCSLCLTAALDLSQAKVREVRSVETDGLGLSDREKHFDLVVRHDVRRDRGQDSKQVSKYIQNYTKIQITEEGSVFLILLISFLDSSPREEDCFWFVKFFSCFH